MQFSSVEYKLKELQHSSFASSLPVLRILHEHSYGAQLNQNLSTFVNSMKMLLATGVFEKFRGKTCKSTSLQVYHLTTARTNGLTASRGRQTGHV